MALAIVDLGERHELTVRIGTNILSAYVLQSPPTNLVGLLDAQVRLRGGVWRGRQRREPDHGPAHSGQ